MVHNEILLQKIFLSFGIPGCGEQFFNLGQIFEFIKFQNRLTSQPGGLANILRIRYRNPEEEKPSLFLTRLKETYFSLITKTKSGKIKLNQACMSEV